MGISRVFNSAAIFALLLAASAGAQEPTPLTTQPYDGIQAGLDAFRLAEEQRQAGVEQQLAYVDEARFWNGYPTSRGATIYYGYLGPGVIFPYDAVPPLVLPPWGVWSGQVFGAGARYLPARQPIGQRQVQTGPNRWESHPVYDPPLTQFVPLPIVQSPLLVRTPYASPRAAASDVPPPAPSAMTGDAKRLPPGPLPRETERPTRGPREY